ncbi:hypothetical protein [Nocardia sp. NPDC020380]|uniref:hypothetical protein n=1 Tax=Nocardia sp. NPDC020380 TaxID=3364309 RepID=UPI0037924931
MTRNDVVNLLTMIASFDQRTVGESDVAPWFAALCHLPYGAARDAVLVHHQTSAERIKPVHVIDLARRASNDRVERASASPVFRDQRDAERDARLAQWRGESPSELDVSTERSRPASDATRKAVIAQIAKLFRRETSQEKAWRQHLEHLAENEGGAAAA